MSQPDSHYPLSEELFREIQAELEADRVNNASNNGVTVNDGQGQVNQNHQAFDQSFFDTAFPEFTGQFFDNGDGDQHASSSDTFNDPANIDPFLAGTQTIGSPSSTIAAGASAPTSNQAAGHFALGGNSTATGMQLPGISTHAVVEGVPTQVSGTNAGQRIPVPNRVASIKRSASTKSKGGATSTPKARATSTPKGRVNASPKGTAATSSPKRRTSTKGKGKAKDDDSTPAKRKRKDNVGLAPAIEPSNDLFARDLQHLDSDTIVRVAHNELISPRIPLVTDSDTAEIFNNASFKVKKDFPHPMEGISEAQLAATVYGQIDHETFRFIPVDDLDTERQWQYKRPLKAPYIAPKSADATEEGVHTYDPGYFAKVKGDEKVVVSGAGYFKLPTRKHEHVSFSPAPDPATLAAPPVAASVPGFRSIPGYGDGILSGLGGLGGDSGHGGYGEYAEIEAAFATEDYGEGNSAWGQL